MPLSFFLARRFYRSAGKDRQRRASKLAIRIATAGVAVGLAVMIVSVCVVKGFQKEIRAKLAGFTAHIEVLDFNSFSSPESFPIVASTDIIAKLKAQPHVSHIQRTSLKMGIIKTDEAFQTIVLKGIGSDYDTTFIKTQLVKGRLPKLASTTSSNEILISRKQATALGIDIGSRVYTYFVSDKISLRRFTVVGLYETNLSQFDDNFVWTDSRTVNQLNDWADDQSSVLEIHLDNYDNIDQAQMSIGQQVNGKSDGRGGTYGSLSVKENPRTSATIQWLSLLDFNVWVILALMVGVAGFTMISGLLILILERTQTIGVLKALGASNTRVRHTFLTYAAFIVMRGLVWGNIIGLGIIGAQAQWGLFRLDPTTYYVDAVPVQILPLWIIGLNVATLIICVIAMIVPSYVISRIRPAKAVRFE